MFEIILIITVLVVFAYSLILLSNLKSKVAARNTALDACNQKLDECLENLKEATRYYEGLKTTYKSHRLGEVGNMKRHD